MSTTVETPAAAVTEAQATPAPTAPSTALAPPVRAAVVTKFDAKDPIALYMDSAIFEQLQRVAKLMAGSTLVPLHLQQKVSDCFLVAAQAFRWGMDPFSVAQHTFVLSSKLGYEGKLIAALINASGRIETNLAPTYTGTKGTPQRGVIITGRIKGERADRTVDGTVADWKTQNAKWTEIPDQMLVYRGAREWARRHMPEVMLGITADEELVERELLVRVDGGVRHVAALDVLTDTIAQRSAVEKVEASSLEEPFLHPAGKLFTGEPPKPAPSPAEEPGVAEAADLFGKPSEGLRCDHGVLLSGACPKCIQATKGAPADRVPGEDDADKRPSPAARAVKAAAEDPSTPAGNPFIRKQREAAAKEEEQRAVAQRATGEKP